MAEELELDETEEADLEAAWERIEAEGLLANFDPYHDAGGKFTSASGVSAHPHMDAELEEMGPRGDALAVHQGPMKKSVASAARYYSGAAGFKDLNDTLRRSGETPAWAVTFVRAAARAELPQGTHLFRGISASSLGREFGGLKPGDTVEAKGMVSTSIGGETAKEFATKKGGVVLQIAAKTGLYIGRKSEHKEELEVVQAHGTKYKYLGESKHHDGIEEFRVLHLEEL